CAVVMILGVIFRSYFVLLLLSFFFTDPAPTEIYTLSLHDALPISFPRRLPRLHRPRARQNRCRGGFPFPSSRWRPSATGMGIRRDRKSTRLNSSHSQISYAVFCLKKKKK